MSSEDELIKRLSRSPFSTVFTEYSSIPFASSQHYFVKIGNYPIPYTRTEELVIQKHGWDLIEFLKEVAIVEGWPPDHDYTKRR